MGASNGTASLAAGPVPGLVGVFDFAASSHRRAISVLVLLSLLAFLPGFFAIPPVDRDEAEYAQVTKQMMETRDYVDVRLRDDVYYQKPVGIYWLQAAAVRSAEALGIANARATIWVYRLPSLIGAIGAVLATYWCALAFVSRRGATLAALLMAGSVLLGVEARLATIDSMLLLATVAAMGVLARTYLWSHDGEIERPGWGLLAVLWTALAVGVLLKGVVILMVVTLAAATLCVIDRSVRWLFALRPLPGIAWLILLASPWFIAMYVRSGDAFFARFIGLETLGKVGGAQQGHGAPPGLYLLMFFVTFFPAATLFGLATPAVWAARREPATRFLLAWLLPSWLLFELIVTKLPHYVLPLYPAVAVLTAGAVEMNTLVRWRWLLPGVIWWFLFPILVSIAVVTCAKIAIGDLLFAAWPFLAAAIVCGWFAWRRYEADGALPSLMRGTATSVLLAIGVYAIVVPALVPAFPSATLASMVRQSGCTAPGVASVGYEEPSLTFLLGTATRFTDGAGAADFLRRGNCRFAFVDLKEVPAFTQRAQTIGLRYDRKSRVNAFDFSNGQPVVVDVFQSDDGPR